MPNKGYVKTKQFDKTLDLNFLGRSKIISYVKQNFSNVNNIVVNDYLGNTE